MAVEKTFFGKVEETEIYQYTMTNGDVSVGILDRGATIHSIVVPDR